MDQNWNNALVTLHLAKQGVLLERSPVKCHAGDAAQTVIKCQTKVDVTSCASEASFASALSAAQNNEENLHNCIPWLRLRAARRKSLIHQLIFIILWMKLKSFQSLPAFKLFSYFIFRSNFSPSFYCKNYHHRPTNFKGLTEKKASMVSLSRDICFWATRDTTSLLPVSPNS